MKCYKIGVIFARRLLSEVYFDEEGRKIGIAVISPLEIHFDHFDHSSDSVVLGLLG